MESVNIYMKCHRPFIIAITVSSIFHACIVFYSKAYEVTKLPNKNYKPFRLFVTLAINSAATPTTRFISKKNINPLSNQKSVSSESAILSDKNIMLNETLPIANKKPLAIEYTSNTSKILDNPIKGVTIPNITLDLFKKPSELEWNQKEEIGTYDRVNESFKSNLTSNNTHGVENFHKAPLDFLQDPITSTPLPLEQGEAIAVKRDRPEDLKQQADNEISSVKRNRLFPSTASNLDKITTTQAYYQQLNMIQARQNQLQNLNNQLALISKSWEHPKQSLQENCLIKTENLECETEQTNQIIGQYKSNILAIIKSIQSLGYPAFGILITYQAPFYNVSLLTSLPK